MRIESIGVSVPSRKVTNDDILNWLEENSRGISPMLIKTYQRMVRGLLSMAGSDTRYIRSNDEKACDFIVEAMERALAKVSIAKEDIDLSSTAVWEKASWSPPTATSTPRR